MATTVVSAKQTASNSSSPFNAFWGWGISTVLLWLLNRDNSSSDSSSQEASKNATDYSSQIGSPVPVVLGRALIKNPLVSYYGDFRADPYTEEYGMHTGIDWAGMIPIIVLGILAICSAEDTVVADGRITSGKESGNSTKSEGATTNGGAKRAAILNVIVQILLWLMTQLFMMHMGRTTIQKGFKYYLGWQHILCWTGDNCGIKKIWMNVYDSDVEESTETGVWDNDNSIAWKSSNATGIVAHIDDEDMFGGVDEGGGFVGDIRFYFGTESQPNDSWMVSQMSKSENISADLKGLTPKYPMYMTCVIPQAYIGKQATVPEMWFEVVNYPNRLGLGRIDDDCNPAEAIYEILKNELWGCNYSDDRIDIDSLKAIGNTLAGEKMGISCLINTTGTVSSYLTTILNHINGVCYDSPQTGKLTFKLIRSDYDVNSLRTFSVANCANMTFTRLDWTETSSTVTANYTDANNKYETEPATITDTANVKITNNYAEKKLEAPYFTTASNVITYVKTQLLSVAYPLSTVNFEANRDAYGLTRGQPINITWEPYGISQQVYRVADVDYGGLTNGKVTVTAIEDVFGFDKTDYEYSHGMDWNEPAYLPEDITRYLFEEIPYEITRSVDTYIYAFGNKPTAYTTYWNVWRYLNGSYTQTAKSSNFSTIGRMVYGYSEGYSKDSVGFEVVPIGVNGHELFEDKAKEIEDDSDIYNSLSGQNVLFCDGEIMSYDSISILPNGDFQIAGVIRGIYDTLPVAHTTESVIFLLESYQSVNTTRPVCKSNRVSNEQLELTSETPDKAQIFDASKLVSMTTKRRSESPSVMGNLTFGANRGTYTEYSYNYPATTIFSDEILFKFNARNKFINMGILSQLDKSVLVADTTQNYIKIVSNGIEFIYFEDAMYTKDYINYSTESLSIGWEYFCEHMGNKLKIANDVYTEIGTYNKSKELYSYDKYEKSFVYKSPIFIGVFETLEELQYYADSIVRDTIISVPGSDYSPAYTYTYNDSCLLFIGKKASNNDFYIMGQDGNKYTIAKDAYRIDGFNNNSNSKAVIHKIDINDKYVFSHHYNNKDYNQTIGYRYLNGVWITFDFYAE